MLIDPTIDLSNPESPAASDYAEATDFTDFFNFGEIIVSPIPEEAYVVTDDDVIADHDPVIDEVTDPVVLDDGTPDTESAYHLVGTDGADRFEFTNGYFHWYTIIGFEPDKDMVVINGAEVGITDVVIDDLNYIDGNLTLSAALQITFATDAGYPAITASDFEII